MIITTLTTGDWFIIQENILNLNNYTDYYKKRQIIYKNKLTLKFQEIVDKKMLRIYCKLWKFINKKIVEFYDLNLIKNHLKYKVF